MSAVRWGALAFASLCGVSCSGAPSAVDVASAAQQNTNHADRVSHSTVPHGDHTPHYGGTVLMKGDLHFEVVLNANGMHRIYFSDAVRAELPASVASEVTLTVSGSSMRAETVQAMVDDTGESWIVAGSPLKGSDVIARVAFVVNNEPYWIEIPYMPQVQ